MAQPYTFKQIKEHMQKSSALHFQGLSKDDVGNKLTDFLNNFFIHNRKMHTIYGNGVVQTNKGKRRSITDIYNICRYYFPRITLTHIYSHLLKLISEGKVLSAICSETKMRVYRGTSGGEYSYFNGDPVDEYQVDLSQFKEFGDCPREKGSWGVADGLDDLKLIKI
jgi:hypothetical protein